MAPHSASLILTRVTVAVGVPGQWVAVLTPVKQGPRFLPTSGATIQMASSVACVQMAEGTENFLRSWPTGDTHHPHLHFVVSTGHMATHVSQRK